jgi:uncharacterized protein YndB with AHSA1/START domain
MTYSTHFNTFTIERDVAADPALTFLAFSTAEGKGAWFVGPSDWKPLIREFDFREGGSERVKGQFGTGKISDFRCQYHDIVPEKRITYTYDMFVDDKRISVSLATIEFSPSSKGTLLKITEQLVHFDGYPTPEDREVGTRYLVEMAASYVESQAAKVAI